MKKAISLFIVLSMVLMSLSGITLVGSAEGTDKIYLTVDGEETEFTTIATPAEFSEKISANTSGNFALVADITLDQVGDTANEISPNYTAIASFSGKLVGANINGYEEITNHPHKRFNQATGESALPSPPKLPSE